MTLNSLNISNLRVNVICSWTESCRFVLIYSSTITCKGFYLQRHRYFIRQNGWSRSYGGKGCSRVTLLILHFRPPELCQMHSKSTFKSLWGNNIPRHFSSCLLPHDPSAISELEAGYIPALELLAEFLYAKFKQSAGLLEFNFGASHPVIMIYDKKGKLQPNLPMFKARC